MLARKRVLIIDDNVDFLELVKETLEEQNYECITASLPSEGLEKARLEKPQLIILDLMLPQMSGFGLMREMKQSAELKHIPIVILTALHDEEVAKEGMDLGAVGYLQKGAATGDLGNALRQFPH